MSKNKTITKQSTLIEILWLIRNHFWKVLLEPTAIICRIGHTASNWAFHLFLTT